jgi:hypothetical protein
MSKSVRHKGDVRRSEKSIQDSTCNLKTAFRSQGYLANPLGGLRSSQHTGRRITGLLAAHLQPEEDIEAGDGNDARMEQHCADKSSPTLREALEVDAQCRKL